MATDSFTGTNGTSLSTYNSAWVFGQFGFVIQSNAAVASEAADCYAYYTGAASGADQYSKAIISGMVSGGHYKGVCARALLRTGQFGCYAVYTDSNSGSGHTEIVKVTNGAGSVLKAVAVTFADGDQIEIRCTGTLTVTVALYKNGVLVDSVTDSTSPWTDGQPGIYAYNTSIGVDNWDGASLAGASTTLTPTPAQITVSGKVPATSAFQNVRIRDVLVSGSGQPVANATDIHLAVWYSGICSGAPDVSLNGLTTDANGSTSWSIPTGLLSYQQPIFYVAQNSLSYSNYTCGRMIPSYE